MADELVPVEGRECGTCAVCCVVLKIDDPALHKEAGIPCVHMVEPGGCAIHARRPDTCRAWFCGYRLAPQLGEAWRPDRAGVLVGFLPCEAPGYPATAFKLTTWEPDAILQPFVLDFIAGNVERGLPTYFVFMSAAGASFKTFLNERLAAVAGKADRPRLVQALTVIMREQAASKAALG